MVVGLRQRQMQAIQSVAREIDHEAGLAQPLPEIVSRFRFVFDDQDFHEFLPLVVNSQRTAILRRTAAPASEDYKKVIFTSAFRRPSAARLGCTR